LKTSSSIKIEFLSNLLPEYIDIWSVRAKVKPYINKVRRCFNCLRWGHSAGFCRGPPLCSRCGEVHDSDLCAGVSFLCPDCKQIHSSFDKLCPIYLKYELVNTVMAFCNVNQFLAKRLIKNKNLDSIEQVERTFKSSAYLAWNNTDFVSGLGTSEISSTPSNIINKNKNLYRRRFGSKRNINETMLERERAPSANSIDNTLVPVTQDCDIVQGVSQEFLPIERRSINELVREEGDTALNSNASIDNLFPAPGIIVKDIYDIYKSNKLIRERDSAVLNYLNLLFRKIIKKINK